MENPIKICITALKDADHPLPVIRSIAMSIAGISQAEISRKHRCHKSAVNHVVQGRRNTPAIQMAIADGCGVAVADLFPAPSPSQPDLNEESAGPCCDQNII
jgi:lambda repressor-like predicted transcriptional regulator